MRLLTKFLILIYNLTSDTDTIIETNVLGSVLPHTLDIKNGLLFTDGGLSIELHRRDAALSGCVFTVGHCSVPPYSEAVLHCTVCTASGRLMPSWWRVPVLVSNFSQDMVMVERFSEVGMVTQVSAIQSVTETTGWPPCGIESLPMHLRDLLDQTSRNLNMQQSQLAGVLLRYADLFPIPGSTFTGHTDAVEHEINTGYGSPI